MPGFTFPIMGRLDITSPPSRSNIADHRYYVPLRLPRVRHGVVRCSLSTPVTLLSILVCVSIISSQDVSRTCPGSVNLLSEHREFWAPVIPLTAFSKETVGSLKFPSYPFGYMPWSRTTVVPPSLVIALRGLLPSVLYRTSAFPLHFVWQKSEFIH